MRIIICGSRDWVDDSVMRHFLQHWGGPYSPLHRREIAIVHGDARGADKMADQIARGLGFSVEPHPADWRGQGRAAGPIRNKLMLDLGVDLVAAFKVGFDGTMKRGGTENMVKIAMAAGVRTIVLPVDTRAPFDE